MIIHNYGEVLLCRDIIFEDNIIDMEYSHPGIVLLPTSNENEEIYCIYMTTDNDRALTEKHKYIRNVGKEKKDSFINLQQIIKRSNMKDSPKTILNENQFKFVLESFYEYQLALNPQKQDFLDIKSKIETLLYILNFNEIYNIKNINLSRKQLDILDSIQDKNKKRIIYGTSIILSNTRNSDKIDPKCFITKKDQEYYEKLTNVYKEISDIDFTKIDFKDSNHALRKIYIDVRNNNYLLNADSFLTDIANLFCLQNNNVKKGEIIKAFLKYEQDRELRKALAKSEKIKRNEKNKIGKISKKKKNKAKEKLKQKRKENHRMNYEIW